MNTKLATSFILASALMLPVAGYAADAGITSTKVYVKDSIITTKVKAELAEEKLASLVHIGVDTDNQGMVTLSGTAKDQSAIDKAVSITRAVKGVITVDNQIQISPDK